MNTNTAMVVSPMQRAIDQALAREKAEAQASLTMQRRGNTVGVALKRGSTETVHYAKYGVAVTRGGTKGFFRGLVDGWKSA